MVGLARRHPVVAYLLAAYVLTWVVWVPRALVDQGLLAWEWPLVVGQVYSYGPALAAVATAAIVAGRPGLRQLGRALVRWRVGWRWYVVVLVAPFAISGIGRLLHEQLTGQAARWPVQEPAELVLLPLLLLVLALTDGVGEEVGWRGYALPHLQERLRPAIASVLLGLVWAAWHLPLFWTRGAVLEGQPFALLLLEVVPMAVLFTWVFNHTRGSMLLASLLHATHNLAGPELPRPDEGLFTPFLLVTSLEWALGLIVLAADPRFCLRGAPAGASAATTPRPGLRPARLHSTSFVRSPRTRPPSPAPGRRGRGVRRRERLALLPFTPGG